MHMTPKQAMDFCHKQSAEARRNDNTVAVIAAMKAWNDLHDRIQVEGLENVEKELGILVGTMQKPTELNSTVEQRILYWFYHSLGDDEIVQACIAEELIQPVKAEMEQTHSASDLGRPLQLACLEAHHSHLAGVIAGNKDLEEDLDYERARIHRQVNEFFDEYHDKVRKALANQPE